MKLVKLSTLAILIGLAMSCGMDQNQDHDPSTAEEAQSEVTASSTKIKLSLNNGAKWAADQSTFTGMKRLELTLYNFNEDNEDPSLSDYNKLGVALADIDKDIISQCSMQGEDHDQLHIILAPMLANVDVIKNGRDMVKLKDNTEALNEALVQFFKHFEVN